jgi:hypothetical protein
MKTKYFLFVLTTIFILGCELLQKDISPDIGVEQSTIGEVGNSFDIYGLEFQKINSAKVSKLENGISSVTININDVDQEFLDMIKGQTDIDINGNSVSITKQFKITKEGVQTVHDEGNFTLIRYDDKEGTTYSKKINGKQAKREIVHKSTDDDYSWLFFNIKVSEVEETGMGFPGVSKVDYVFNHKFGLVAAAIHYDDGTQSDASINSQSNN